MENVDPSSQSNIVKLSVGEAVVKPFIDRKTSKLYNRTILKNITPADLRKANKKGEDAGELPISLEQLDESSEVLVLGLVERVDINGTTHTAITSEVLDKLPNEDYETLLTFCTDIMKKEQERKKKSQENLKG